MKQCGYIIANFGGPRNLDEIYPFLQELLSDQDVIRTSFPQWLHRLFFSWVARKRTGKVRHEYVTMGGRSPIYAHTEEIAKNLKEKLHKPVIAFHRYLRATHQEFLKQISLMDYEEIVVFPLFPQFTYATSGSIARWFKRHLSPSIIQKIRWIRSYPDHLGFVSSYQAVIRDFLLENELDEKDTLLIFSAHGIPQEFVDTGDPYPQECSASFHAVMQAFPQVLGRLSYQSKFGKGEWIKPYTIDTCHEIQLWNEGRKEIVFVPIAFTSDHIETLCEIEKEYMTVIRKKGFRAYRVPALNRHPEWLEGIVKIIRESKTVPNDKLIFHSF